MTRNASPSLAIALMAMALACTPDELSSPPPQVDDADLSVAEHRPAGALVGTLTATVAEGRKGSFKVVDGDPDGVFALDATGRLTVAKANALDFETTPSFTLQVEVTDDATPPGTGRGEVRITLTDVNEAPVLDDVTLHLSELAEAGTVVGTLVVKEPDAGQIHTFAILDGNTGDTFAVGATSGVLTLASTALLDFETLPSFTLTVRITDSGTPALSDEATITISVVDKDEPPVITSGSFTLDEHSQEGTLVGRISVVDDPGDLTFTLTGGNTGGAFGLDASTGALVVANPLALDFETTPVFSLAVRVTDAKGLFTDATVTVSLQDVNETPTLSGGPFSLPENSPVATPVGALSVTDVDAGQTVTLAIVGGNDLNAFAFSGPTLVVANPAALDFEARSSFELTVRATDDGAQPLFVDLTVVVELVDVNEAPAMSGGPFTLEENSAAGTVIGTLSASDPEAGQSVILTIEAGNELGLVELADDRLVVAEGAVLDYETTPLLTLTVRATDDASPPAFSDLEVVVQLIDVNESPSLEDASLSVNENTPPGTEVGVLTAVDPDEGQSLLFGIVSGNDGNTFALHPTTGALTIVSATLLDFELRPSFTLSVRVTDDGTPGLSATRDFTVQVLDVDEPPAISDATFSIDENSPDGTLVGVLTATDPDSGATLTFAQESGHDEAFALSADGRLTVADTAALDFETSPSFTLPVRVTDDTGLFADATVTVSLRDVNEAPVISADVASVSVREDRPAGWQLVEFLTDDQDAGQTVTLSIVSGNTGNAFALSGGWLVVNDLTAFDYEMNPSFSLTLRATDDGSPALHTQLSITIELEDVNEAPTVTQGMSFSVPSNATVGQTIGQLTATDPDGNQTLTWAFATGAQTSGYFGLEASTGRLYVATLTTADGPLSGRVGQNHNLSVRVADDGSPQQTGSGSVSVLVTSTSEPPTDGSLSFVAYTDGAYSMNIGEQASLGTPAAQVTTFGGGHFGASVFPAGSTAEFTRGSLKVDADGKITASSYDSGTLTFSVQVQNTAGSATLDVSIVFCVALEPGAAAHYYQQSELCLKGGAEYVFVPTNLTSSSTPGAGAVNLTTKATGIVPVVGAPTPNLVPSGAASLAHADAPEIDHAFDEALRRKEIEDLTPLIASARAALRAGPNLNIVPGVPAVGDFMTLNTASASCDNPDNRTGRVAAVSTHAVVIDEWKADRSGPVVPNGFTTAQFQQIAQRFDDEIWPVIATTFGVPMDIDNNGRIVIFYTSAVNQLTPPGNSSYVGGFVHSRDVFPTADCATSNVGEMFYMLSPDPSGLFGNVRTVDFVFERTFGTLAHEFQHLINASRRLYVNGASVFETVWLNEGLSHVAEELMFHELAGTAPGQNLDLDDIRASQQTLDAFNQWAISNFGRLSSWLEAPHLQGPFAPNDTLATRGAIWAFLRYAADRKGGSQTALWSALVNSTTAGLDNLDEVLEDNALWWVSDFTHAMYLDDSGLVVEPRHTQPSWDFRSIFPAFTPGYPLAVHDAVNGASFTRTLSAGGGSAFVRMGVAAGEHGVVSMLSDGQAPPSSVELTIIRRK